MNLTRRLFVALGLAASLLGSGCVTTAADTAQARADLSPSGSLRVGVYPGSPTSLVVKAKGERTGMAYELGRALGHQLEVPVVIVEYNRVAQVIDALKAGTLDFTFTNATEARARDVDFSEPLIGLELGYLALVGSPIQSIDDVDRPNMRIGVTQGSTSQGTLAALFKNATVVPASSLKQAQEMLQQRSIDAFATNKGILFEMADDLPSAKVLPGRWGIEQLAMAIPKGRPGMPYLRNFARDLRASGKLQEIVERAGVRGLAKPEIR
jgi:polar amino acid transport system substrate-binding protein